MERLHEWNELFFVAFIYENVFSIGFQFVHFYFVGKGVFNLNCECEKVLFRDRVIQNWL